MSIWIRKITNDKTIELDDLKSILETIEEMIEEEKLEEKLNVNFETEYIIKLDYSDDNDLYNIDIEVIE